MGLFSGKKKTVPSTSFSRMIGDADLDSAILQGVNSYIFNGGDYAEILRHASFRAIHRKMHRISNWAKEPGNYGYGSPETRLVSVDGTALLGYVESYINSTKGITLNKAYAALGGINHYHMGWDALMDNQGYDPKTNEITSTLGVPIYVENMVVHYHASIIDRYSESGRSPRGWSGLSGYTQNRAANYAAAIPAYVIDAPTHDFALVTLTCRGTFTTTQTVVQRKVTRTLKVAPFTVDVSYTTTSDVTVDGYDFTEPPYTTKTTVSTGVDSSPAPVTTAAGTRTDATYDYVDEDVTTVTVTVDTYDYLWNIENSFLPYEFSGDPAAVLDATDTSNIDATAVAPTPIGADDDWIIFGYTYTEASVDHIGYFTYDIGSNELPDIENNIGDYTAIGDYYPRLYARLDGRKCNADDLRTTDGYLSSKKFARKLGLKYNKWIDDIHDNVGSLGKVWCIALGFNVPMNTTNPIDLEYLHKYFKRHYESLDPGVLLEDITDAAFTEARIFTGIHSIKDNRMNQSLDYIGIASVSGTGTGFTPNTYEKLTGSCSYNTHAEIVFNFSGGTFIPGYTETSDTAFVHTYRYYTSSTTYEEYSVLGASSGVQVQGNLWSSALAEDDNLMVPLDDSMRLYIRSRKMETLVGRSAHLIFNSVTVIKTKWYQTSVFAVLMVVAAIVICVVIDIVSLGGATPTNAFIMASVISAVTTAVISYVVVTAVFKLAIALGLDPKIAAVLATIALIIVGQGGKGVQYLQTAKGILNTVNLALQQYTKALSYEMADIAKDMQDLMKLQKDTLDKYSDQLAKMVDNNSGIDAELIRNRVLSPLINLGESSSSFYSRTAVIDVAELVWQQLIGYYALKLALPDASNTIRTIGEHNG